MFLNTHDDTLLLCLRQSIVSLAYRISDIQFPQNVHARRNLVLRSSARGHKLRTSLRAPASGEHFREEYGRSHLLIICSLQVCHSFFMQIMQRTHH